MGSMTITVFAQVATPVGHGCQWDLAGDPDPFNLPASGFRQNQPKWIPVHVEHETDWTLGHVVHLERSTVDGLLAVAVLDADIADLLSDGRWYVSPGVRVRSTGTMQFGDAVIDELSLVRRPASINTQPVRWSRSDVRTDSGGAPHGMPLRWHDLHRRAHLLATSYTHQRRATELTILDVEASGDEREAWVTSNGGVV